MVSDRDRTRRLSLAGLFQCSRGLILSTNGGPTIRTGGWSANMRIGSFTAVDFSRSIGCINCAIAVAAKPITKPNTDNIRGLGCRLMPPQFTDLRVCSAPAECSTEAYRDALSIEWIWRARPGRSKASLTWFRCRSAQRPTSRRQIPLPALRWPIEGRRSLPTSQNLCVRAERCLLD